MAVTPELRPIWDSPASSEVATAVLSVRMVSTVRP
jgi:hypothetical protein